MFEAAVPFEEMAGIVINEYFIYPEKTRISEHWGEMRRETDFIKDINPG